MSWPRRVLAIPATQGIFSLLGVPATQGRTFLPDDLERGCTLVLAHRFWQDQLGSASDVVGSSLTLDATTAVTYLVGTPRPYEAADRVAARPNAGNRAAPKVVISATTPPSTRRTSSLKARNSESPGRRR